MSVSLTPLNDPDCESIDFSNGSWERLAILAEIPWNGNHDPIIYTPEQLRAIAKVIPLEWSEYGWAQGLEWLAKSGGAELG